MEFDIFCQENAPSFKIYIDLELNYLIVFSQSSNLESNERNYFIRYKYKLTKAENSIENHPWLFIFLIDQSFSMSGTWIKMASQSLQLFLKSLSIGSYYQIIDFGSIWKIWLRTKRIYFWNPKKNK